VNLPVELLEPAFIVFRVPIYKQHGPYQTFYRRSQGLLVRRLSRPGTKARARTLNIGSKKKNEGCRNEAHSRAGSEELTIKYISTWAHLRGGCGRGGHKGGRRCSLRTLSYASLISNSKSERSHLLTTSIPCSLNSPPT